MSQRRSWADASEEVRKRWEREEERNWREVMEGVVILAEAELGRL